MNQSPCYLTFILIGILMNKVIAIVIVFLVPILAYAESGEAIIPHWYKNQYNQYTLRVSNISNVPVTVSITLYDQAGNEYTEASESASIYTSTDIFIGDGFTSDPVGGSATLQAGESGYIQVKYGTTVKWGYGKIKWASNEKNQVALIAVGMVDFWLDDRAGRTTYPINNLLPF
ncbi:MAG: hypothetical protein MI864_17290 [Pseudomonadales bacterium]|nr:hypothetical protein [Pseudomonadales bacterium]